MVNSEKVYIEGYVVGFMVDATGAREKQIQVSSGETVSIDESFIHKSITPEKVKIPQMVADWIDACKENLAIGLYTAMNPDFLKQWNKSDKLISWVRKINNQNLFATAWLDGYEVEKEKKYRVTLLNPNDGHLHLVNLKSNGDNILLFTQKTQFASRSFELSKSEIIASGFGWVFSCEGVEVEEVL